MTITRSKREAFTKKFEVKCKSLILEPEGEVTKIIIDGVHIFRVNTIFIKEFLESI